MRVGAQARQDRRTRGHGTAQHARDRVVLDLGTGPQALLARLAEREGREGDALRTWREIAEIDPGNAEAAARAGR